MAWWQKKLLHYALSRTGLFDDTAIDLKNLDVTLGRKNVVELKDVGLNIKRLTLLARLPPSLRIETARVLVLRLTVPADIYQSSIVAEVDGLVIATRLGEEKADDAGKEKARARSPMTERSPQHRKVHRRIPSPPAYRPDGLGDDDVNEHIPTTQEMARSFLLDGPPQEIRELEATLAADTSTVEQSVSSMSSGSEVGTGAPVGLPGFLAGFLQGIIDRLQVFVRDVEIKVDSTTGGDGQEPIPFALRLRVGSAELRAADDSGSDVAHTGKRHLKLQNIKADILSNAASFTDLASLPSRSSPANSRRPSQHSTIHSASIALPVADSPTQMDTPSTTRSFAHPREPGRSISPAVPDAMGSSTITDASYNSAVSMDERKDPGVGPHDPLTNSEFDIRLGDDNTSWASRRMQVAGLKEDLWNSVASEDDLPESLLLERVSTPRAPSSHGQSPIATRSRRTVSPYDRGGYSRSAGSWPCSDESGEHSVVRQSPGSWPVGDHTYFDPAQPITPGPNVEDGTDNKRAALESFTSHSEAMSQRTTAASDEQDDMAQSRFYSHEEAASIYMSAISQGSNMAIPGAWASEGPPSELSHEEVPDNTRTSMSAMHGPGRAQSDHAGISHPLESSTGNATPRARSPEPASPQTERSMSARQLFHIDSVSIWVPSKEKESTEIAESRQQSPEWTKPEPKSSAHGIPGAFSAYNEASSPRRASGSRVLTTEPVPTTHNDAGGNDQTTEIDVGDVEVQVDVPCARLLYVFVQSASTPFRSVYESPRGKSETHEEAQKSSPFRLLVKRIQVALVETVPAQIEASNAPTDTLCKLTCERGSLNMTHHESIMQLGRVHASVGSAEVLSFDRQDRVDSSLMFTEDMADLNVTISSRLMLTRRPVTEVSIDTRQLRFNFDLTVVDETLGSFGGISGILELGNSILSESTTLGTIESPAKVSKGVRFQDDAKVTPVGSELKVNVRIGGCELTLLGEACALNTRSTSIKVVHREHATVIAIAEVQFTGPYSAGAQTAPISAILSNLRLQYHTSPAETDLERLLSLLTPSKDKYDTDDDILIDTLLRQRRKGGLVRMAVGGVKLRIADYDCFKTLGAFGDELSRLSAVAKYLPEDDRPGLLTLFHVATLEARVPINERFGELRMVCSSVQGAQVGLPALLALSFGSINAGQTGKPDAIHPLIPTAGIDSLPMLMARMVGNEAEPSVKVKLLNVCVEYDVPTLLALSGKDDRAEMEAMATELAKSIADLTIQTSSKTVAQGSSTSNAATSSAKRTKIDLLVHDSAVGLNPDKLPSKGLLILSQAAFSTVLPPNNDFQVTLEMNKAALFVTDAAARADSNIGDRAPRASNTAASKHVTEFLSSQGYASVASMMSARFGLDIQKNADSSDNVVVVDASTELLLLETCADSTQTMLAVLGALSLPPLPEKKSKYRTEPMTIEDMMASFTGEPEVKPVDTPETLFDIDADLGDDADMHLDAAAFHEDDDLLIDSEMTSSLYGPVSGILGGDDKPDGDDDDTAGDYSGTVESLLEEDPFEMTLAPTNTGLSDVALLRDLTKQCKPAVNAEPADLGVYEIEDLGFDALPANDGTLGTRHRFNTPASARRGIHSTKLHARSPFRLRLRDTHVIWNIYDGYDWQRTRDGITEAVERVEAKTEERKQRRRQSLEEREEEEPIIGDFLFNSIYIGVPGDHDIQELRRQINRGIDDLASEADSVPMSGISRPTTYSASGRPLRSRKRRLKLERSKKHKIAFELKELAADFIVFPPDSGEIVSSVDVRIQDCEIFDNVPTSTWRKFLTQRDSQPGTREMCKPMAHIELHNVRTLQDYAASEIVLHVSILPLRLHVDQDALDFTTRFFEFKDDSMTVPASPGEKPFIQRLEVDTVDLQLDYKPKYVDYAGLRSGHTTEFMNFVTLDAANIRLKHAIVYGIRGFEPLHKTLNDVWMPDIMRNQLPVVLAGLAPVRSLVNLGSGMRDIVAIPVREYKKDGRIVRSIQKGAFQFGKTTASELARLGAKVAIGTQTMLQGAEGLLSPSSASPSGRRASFEQGWHDVDPEGDDHEQRAVSAYANQPLGLLPGLRSARRHLEHDLLTARDALIAVQGEVMDSGTPGAAAAAVAKHAPTVILRPVIGATRAIGTTLLGVGNQIDRGNVKRMEDKYKR